MYIDMYNWLERNKEKRNDEERIYRIIFLFRNIHDKIIET